MRMSLLAILTMTLAGCATGAAVEPLCARSQAARSAHAAALVVDGGAQSRATGRTLIALIDAGCDE